MDSLTAMEAVTETAKAATKFQEILQKIFGPTWTRKQADADAYADERKLQTIRENPDMEIVYTQGVMSARERSQEALAERAEQRMLSEAVRQEENIEKVLDVAWENLQNLEISEDDVDEDWLVRFFSIVKDISTEEMQFIWGKILAGEIKRPSTFSLRTLEAIKNISQKEAMLFKDIAPYVIKHGGAEFLIGNIEVLEKYGVHYGQLLILDECGLIRANTTVSLRVLPNQKDKDLVYNKECALLIKRINDTKEEIFINVYALTKVGKELMSIIESDSNVEYLIDVAESIFTNESRYVEISAHLAITVDREITHYVTESMKTFSANTIHKE